MEEDSANEMDSNQPISSHHPTHHQHHLDLPLNDSKKRSNNHNPVHYLQTSIFFQFLNVSSSSSSSRLCRLEVIIHRYQ